MALSPLQKIEAFNINTELQKDMSKLMQNTLCLPISAAYVAATKVLNAFVGPVALMKKQIVSALDNNPVTKALTDASKILNIVNANIGLPTLQISAQGLDAMNIFKTICLDFDDILPNAMKKLISNAAAAVNDGYHDMLDSADEMYDMPDEMVDMVDDAMGALKDKALSGAFDDAINAVMTPLMMYRAFIKSSGIVEMIKRLQKFEKCMTNPKGCNRPSKEMFFPGTTKYNSQYYMELFAINLKGELQLAQLSSQVKGIEGKASETIKKLDAFKNPIDPKALT